MQTAGYEGDGEGCGGASGELATLNVNLVPAADSQLLVSNDQQTTRQIEGGKTLRNSSSLLALGQVLATDERVKSGSGCHPGLRQVHQTFFVVPLFLLSF